MLCRSKHSTLSVARFASISKSAGWWFLDFAKAQTKFAIVCGGSSVHSMAAVAS